MVSCEHAGNEVPARYRHCFAGREKALATHRGYDPGALAATRVLARRLGVGARIHRVSRLLVEPNRSLHHRALFSEATAGLDAREREAILQRYYHPHRNGVEADVRAALARGAPVLHLSVHTFTPVLRGRRRATDIGLLYDPARPRERKLAAAWVAALRDALPGLRVHRNAPYCGAADGLTTALRRRFRASEYLGFELELNQRLVGAGAATIARPVAATLAALLARPG